METLDELIVGRVKPSIYAFSTNTVPNYLKVGDTYRPVPTRLAEWKKYFPDLIQEFKETAALSDDIFFRDYSIHQYLEYVLHKYRLQECDIPIGMHYSKEFFKDTTNDDVSAAIQDIRMDFKNNTGKYKFYDTNTKLPETFTYASTGKWMLRPNQEQTVENFKKAVSNGRKNLLMYAVMRFGKSFTSLYCAKEINAKLVLIVSAKADVKEEWKKTVESAENFNKEYVFLSSDDLLREKSVIQSKFNNNKKVIVFLTLQDLQGNEIKDKHKELFKKDIDLLIVDETHYGARAESYGKVIREVNYEKDVKEKYADDDFIEYVDAEEALKSLSVNITLHLSGTPYRILMGSEFEKEDIIAFYQFTDIVKDQKQWDEDNLLNEEPEWNNPYYGFPQMVRFAFTPSKSALELLDALKNKGVSYAFSELFKPESIKKDNKNNKHKKFIHEQEVLELFMAIDGSKTDDGLLSFLDYDKIKEGKMCQHIVVVLPYCSSCDALENLIKSHSDDFKNLQQYKIINISGVDNPNEYNNIQIIKNKIKSCDEKGQKTITLTVNRMLTGSTVEQWDTMIYLKDTASPQEYDQAIFRLQNQYIKKYVNDTGEEIKYNMKPQTLLVDFDPHRMFSMQEQKSMIYNVNTDAAGNQHLKERLDEELKISPIIQINKNKISKVEPNDILTLISQYSASKGVLEETMDIPVDMSLLNYDELKKIIEQQSELGTKGGLSIEAYSSNNDGDDFDNSYDDNNSNENNDTNVAHDNSKDQTDIKKTKSLEDKFRTYYSRILFLAFLTKDTVKSLDDIIAVINTTDNCRIAKNLGVSENILSLIKEHINLFILRQLDYKIQNINMLAHDDSVEPIKRALTAIKKFDRISDSEVTTPNNVANNMISLIPDDCFIELPNGKILDIASKMGEFAIAIVHRCNDLGIQTDAIADKIMSIPTSSVAYEFTRKVYEVLGLNVNMIVSNFNSYDLLNIKETDKDSNDFNKVNYNKIKTILSQKCMANEMTLNNVIKNEGEQLKFNAVVGNPPYHEDDGGAGASARPIYPDFVNIAKTTSSKYSSLIIPTRWFTGGKHLDKFRLNMLKDIHIKELHDFLHPEEIFPNTNNRGGICYILWDNAYDNKIDKSHTMVVTHGNNGKVDIANRTLKTRDLDLFVRSYKAISILDKVISSETTEIMSNYISARKPFGIESNIVKTKDWHLNAAEVLDAVQCFGKGQNLGYVSKSKITSNKKYLDCWKVFTPRANNVGTELNDDNLNTFIGQPSQICTEAYIMIGCGMELNKTSVKNLAKYFNTKFVRFMHGLAKSSHDAPRSTYRFVPVVDFNEEWTDEKLYNKFGLSQDEIELVESSIKPMN